MQEGTPNIEIGYNDFPIILRQTPKFYPIRELSYDIS